jgi:hypothetical protein
MTYLLEGFVHLCMWEVLGTPWVFATARLVTFVPNCTFFWVGST